jgi:argininosuccinate synthase
LGTSTARPLIAKILVDYARKEGASAICHGATGKGNDQVRFELGIMALGPEFQILAPWKVKEWKMKSREDEIRYLKRHSIECPVEKKKSYSMDDNIWHISHEGLELEEPANEPSLGRMLKMTTPPEKAPDTPEYVEIEFEKGIPVAVDGKKMKGAELIELLNKLGGENGVGTIDIVENRLVGMKSRGVYETPGGTILYHAHEVLETLCLDKETAHYKQQLAIKYADLVYNGQWYTPLREALDAFVNKTQETVTGRVRLKLYKGNIINAGVWSEYSLYSEELASFGESDYDQKEAEGFINLFGLPVKVKALLDEKRGE